MNKGLFFYLLSTLALLGANDPPVIAPPDNFACSVAVTFHGILAKDAAPGAMTTPADSKIPTVKSDTITQTGNLRRDVLTWSDGTTSEAWTMVSTGFTMLEKAAGTTKGIYKMPKKSSMRALLFPTILDMDTASLTWLNPSSFVDKNGLKGRNGSHYQSHGFLYNFVPAKSVAIQAWVDAKSFIPFAFDDGQCLYELTFTSPPTEPLVLPDRFKEDMEYYQRANGTIKHL